MKHYYSLKSAIAVCRVYQYNQKEPANLDQYHLMLWSWERKCVHYFRDGRGRALAKTIEDEMHVDYSIFQNPVEWVMYDFVSAMSNLYRPSDGSKIMDVYGPPPDNVHDRPLEFSKFPCVPDEPPSKFIPEDIFPRLDYRKILCDREVMELQKKGYLTYVNAYVARDVTCYKIYKFTKAQVKKFRDELFKATGIYEIAYKYDDRSIVGIMAFNTAKDYADLLTM